MEARLISYPENIIDIIYTACRTCYSGNTPQDLYDNSKEKDNETKLKLICKVLDSGHASTVEHVNFTFAISGVSRALLAQLTRHRMCLSGDTKIQRLSHSKKSKTLEELYNEWQDNKRKCTREQLVIRTVNLSNGTLIQGTKIRNVFYNGIQDIYKIKTKLGYEIKATLNHKFFNSKGEFILGELKVGDKIYVNGIELYKDKEWFKQKYCIEGYNTTQIAEMCGIKPITARKWKQKHNIPTDNKNFKRILSQESLIKISEANKNRYVSLETRQKLSLAKRGKYYKNVADLSEDRLRTIHRRYKGDKCAVCGATDNLEAHHIDKNINNLSPNNCITLCSACHHNLHGKNYRFKNIFEDNIISIEYVGKEKTYDLETESENHNYVANGFLVHNCSYSVQSQRYVEIKEDLDDLIILKTCGAKFDKMQLLSKYFTFKDDNDLFINAYLDDLITYLKLIKEGYLAEDARNVLPNATKTNIVFTCNLRELMHICSLRLCVHAQLEIRNLFKLIKQEVISQENCEWLKKYLVSNCKNCTDFRGCKGGK